MCKENLSKKSQHETYNKVDELLGSCTAGFTFLFNLNVKTYTKQSYKHILLLNDTKHDVFVKY